MNKINTSKEFLLWHSLGLCNGFDNSRFLRCTGISTVVPNAEAILNTSDALGSVPVFLMLETVVSETSIFFAIQR